MTIVNTGFGACLQQAGLVQSEVPLTKSVKFTILRVY